MPKQIESEISKPIKNFPDYLHKQEEDSDPF